MESAAIRARESASEAVHIPMVADLEIRRARPRKRRAAVIATKRNANVAVVMKRRSTNARRKVAVEHEKMRMTKRQSVTDAAARSVRRRKSDGTRTWMQPAKK